jgi:hypothetical protein
MIKTKKMMRLNPGDLFYIPAMNKLKEPGVVIGRSIDYSKAVGHLVEVFDSFHAKPLDDLIDVRKIERLFRPVYCDLYFSPMPRWRIFHSDPNYDKEMSNYSAISIVFLDGDICTGDQSRSASQSELEKIEPATTWRMDHLIFRVNAHLAGIFKKDELFDYHKMPPEYRVDNEITKTQVYELANHIEKWFA